MIFGVQRIGKLSSNEIIECGFSITEGYLGRNDKKESDIFDIKSDIYLKCESNAIHYGITVSLLHMDKFSFSHVISTAKESSVNYIVVETVGCEIESFKKFVTENSEVINETNIPIFLENGMLGNDTSGYQCGVYSDAKKLLQIVRQCNEILGYEIIGIAFNTGYANLLSKNLRSFIYDVRDYLKLVHINDNDGTHNDMQLPYTFTRGRGALTTDWMWVVEELKRISFDGYMIFDTRGLFCRSPKELHITFLNMLYAISNEWNRDFDFERDILNLSGKKLILFGAGQMAGNFMRKYGENHTPFFIVDNDKKKWGQFFMGVEIKNPDTILSIPDDERNVIICNMYYEAIAMQLGKMGVKYTKCDDRYLM